MPEFSPQLHKQQQLTPSEAMVVLRGQTLSAAGGSLGAAPLDVVVGPGGDIYTTTITPGGELVPFIDFA